MRLLKQDWFSLLGADKTCCLWTGNTTITRSGNAVMGAGLAKQLVFKHPDIKQSISNKIKATPKYHEETDKYGNKCTIHVPELLFINRKIGMFPVKLGWWQDADLSIIQVSAIALNITAKRNTDYTFVLNFPGIGAGNLKYDDVLPILQQELTQDNIIVVTK